jgi:HSP20 family protein
MSIKTVTGIGPSFGLTSFSDFFEPWNEWFREGALAKQMSSPKVNITESKDSYNMEVAAPGLNKEDFNIDVSGNLLTISGQKEENKEEKEEKYTRQEYNYSSFSRSFTIPEEVQADKIEATYEGGILKLILPKKEETVKSNGKTITVK